ncbi:MAG: diguanylate cyclase [Campylobacterales bacterium]|nr:diguanylate cyclase [Campylobacterales bacterium]
MKIKNSLKTSIILNITLLHAILMGFVVFDLIDRQKEFMKDSFSSKATMLSKALALNVPSWLLSKDYIALQESINPYKNMGKEMYSTFILDRFERVVASTEQKYFNKILTDDISKLLITNIENSTDDSYCLPHNALMDCIHKIKMNSFTIGYTRIILDTKELEGTLKNSILKGVIYIFIAIILGAVLAYIVANRVTKKLEVLTNVVKEFTDKKYDVDVPEIGGNDELTTLSCAFKTMADSIKSYIKTQEEIQNVLFSEKEFAQTTLKSIENGVITVDNNFNILDVNYSALKLLHLDEKTILNKNIVNLFNFDEEMKFKFLELLDSGSFIDEELNLNIKNLKITLNVSLNQLKNKQNDVIGYVFIFKDVTKSKMLQKELEYHSTHDELTKLYNRRGFNIKLNELFDYDLQIESTHALLYLDLDKFKEINDTLGHQAGDEMLKAISSILLYRIRLNDIVSRLGGDEFAIVLVACKKEKVLDIAESIRVDIEKYEYVSDNRNFKTSASIGVVIFDTFSNIDSIELLRRADLACYKAKELGKNRIYLYTKETELK